ncbi:Asp-tRNA(Asn)/Glu-tRNA(Gln) amidotransferase subunit GatC [Reichenbachiella carrageenanivorans]|uniref:Aspartyl/glutamyl-tRNA(Asn/Gln) amidotransferase subunit C n=1 Tax=Reichenbachiella carrageenanivorans TaxID=2979869 RepID=A0ABY6D0G4_9BACT|nr:Asp-tRNA(Asn)/Glu-tRNA(Gln) amidotransferase subunit GatC [Reichenbachiella carrageenanivorans]UXX79664.1 Asp-tRNA(Asn)/Glu-tRNA(Gln) amidotransferase subunit GatC [Reichenbachiella carrageenanivorans]
MAIDKNTVQKLAQLSRLELSEKEQEKLSTDLGDILDWVEKLEEVNTADVAPLGNVNEEPIHLRIDKSDNYFSGEEALKNAPESDQGHFIVPKVLN